MNELEEILRKARAALADNVPEEVVNAAVAEKTSGQFQSVSALSQHLLVGGPENPAMARLNARGGNGATDFLQMAAHGLSFGTSDELRGLGAALVPGGKGYTEARDDQRQFVSDMRELSPGASAMSEIAGGTVVPMGAGAAVATRLVRPGAGIVAKTLARGAGAAATGAAGAAAYGAGDTDGGLLPRAQGALDAAKVGGPAGFVLGAGLPLLAGGAGKTTRFLRELVSPEAAGRAEGARGLRRIFSEAGIAADEVPTRMGAMPDIAVHADMDPSLARAARNARNQAPSLDRAGGPVSNLIQRAEGAGDRLTESFIREAALPTGMERGKELAQAAIEDVRVKAYAPLEAAVPVIDDPEINTLLRMPEYASKLPAEVASGARPLRFRELQDILIDLRDDASAAARAGRPGASQRANVQYKMLRELMGVRIEGFNEAQGLYEEAVSVLHSFDDGYKMADKPTREISEHLRGLSPDAQRSFRIGLLEKWTERLGMRDTGGGPAQSIIHAGSELRGRIRAVFGSDDAYNRFLRDAGLEEVYAITKNTVTGNSTTALQASDAMESMPMSRVEIANKLWHALFSPGEARRVQHELVGRLLLGRDTPELVNTLTPSKLGRSLFRISEGVPGALGAVAPGPGRSLLQ